MSWKWCHGDLGCWSKSAVAQELHDQERVTAQKILPVHMDRGQDGAGGLGGGGGGGSASQYL